jgi:hypothetical protein
MDGGALYTDYILPKICKPLGDSIAPFVSIALYPMTTTLFILFFIGVLKVGKKVNYILYTSSWFVAFGLAYFIGNASKYLDKCDTPFINMRYTLPQPDLSFLCILALQEYHERISEFEFFELVEQNPRYPYLSIFKKEKYWFIWDVFLLIFHIVLFNVLFYYTYILSVLECFMTTFLFAIPYYFVFKFLTFRFFRI